MLKVFNKICKPNAKQLHMKSLKNTIFNFQKKNLSTEDDETNKSNKSSSYNKRAENSENFSEQIESDSKDSLFARKDDYLINEQSNEGRNKRKSYQSHKYKDKNSFQKDEHKYKDRFPKDEHKDKLNQKLFKNTKEPSQISKSTQNIAELNFLTEPSSHKKSLIKSKEFEYFKSQYQKSFTNLTFNIFEKTLDNEIDTLINNIEENIERVNPNFDLKRVNNSNIFKYSHNASNSITKPVNENPTSQGERHLENDSMQGEVQSDDKLINNLRFILESNKLEGLENLSKEAEKSKNPEILSLLLEIYTNTNIDKAMSFFNDIFNLSTQMKDIRELDFKSVQHFISRCVSLDKTKYLVEILNLAKIRNYSFGKLDFRCFSDYISYYSNNNFYYDNSLLVLDYANYHIYSLLCELKDANNVMSTENFNITKQEIEIRLKNMAKFINIERMSGNFLNVRLNDDSIFNLAEFNTDNLMKLVCKNYKSLKEVKEFVKVPGVLKFDLVSACNLFTLFYDDQSYLSKALSFSENLDVNEREVFFQSVLVNAKLYYNTHNIIPIGLEMENIKNDYLKLYSETLNSKDNLHESLLEIFAFIFKINEQHNYLADLLSQWNLLTNTKNSKILTKLTAEFIINSNVEKGTFFYKEIDKIYTNIMPESIIMKTMAYFKDGNSQRAIEHSTQIENNNNELFNMFNKSFKKESENKEAPTTPVFKNLIQSETKAKEAPATKEARAAPVFKNLIQNPKTDLKDRDRNQTPKKQSKLEEKEESQPQLQPREEEFKINRELYSNLANQLNQYTTLVENIKTNIRILNKCNEITKKDELISSIFQLLTTSPNSSDKILNSLNINLTIPSDKKIILTQILEDFNEIKNLLRPSSDKKKMAGSPLQTIEKELFKTHKNIEYYLLKYNDFYYIIDEIYNASTNYHNSKNLTNYNHIAHNLNTFDYSSNNIRQMQNTIDRLRSRKWNRSNNSNLASPHFNEDLDAFYQEYYKFLTLQDIKLNHVKNVSNNEFLAGITDGLHLELNNNKLNESINNYVGLVKSFLVSQREKYFKVTKVPYVNANLEYLEKNLNINLLIHNINLPTEKENIQEALKFNRTLLEELQNTKTKRKFRYSHHRNILRSNFSSGLLSSYSHLLRHSMNLSVKDSVHLKSFVQYANQMLRILYRNSLNSHCFTFNTHRYNKFRFKNVVQASLNHLNKNKMNYSLIPLVNLKMSNNIINIKKQIKENLSNINKIFNKNENVDKFEEQLSNLSKEISDCLSLPETSSQKTQSTKDIINSKESSSKQDELAVMKAIMNQDLENISEDLVHELILFGIRYNFPEAIKLGEMSCIFLKYSIPKWLETQINEFILNDPVGYNSSMTKIGKLNLSSLYRNIPTSDVNIQETKLKELLDTGRVKKDKDNPDNPSSINSFFASDYKQFGDLEVLLPKNLKIQDIHKRNRLFMQKLNKL